MITALTALLYTLVPTAAMGTFFIVSTLYFPQTSTVASTAVTGDVVSSSSNINNSYTNLNKDATNVFFLKNTTNKDLMHNYIQLQDMTTQALCYNLTKDCMHKASTLFSIRNIKPCKILALSQLYNGSPKFKANKPRSAEFFEHYGFYNTYSFAEYNDIEQDVPGLDYFAESDNFEIGEQITDTYFNCEFIQETLSSIIKTYNTQEYIVQLSVKGALLGADIQDIYDYVGTICYFSNIDEKLMRKDYNIQANNTDILYISDINQSYGAVIGYIKNLIVDHCYLRSLQLEMSSVLSRDYIKGEYLDSIYTDKFSTRLNLIKAADSFVASYADILSESIASKIIPFCPLVHSFEKNKMVYDTTNTLHEWARTVLMKRIQNEPDLVDFNLNPVFEERGILGVYKVMNTIWKKKIQSMDEIIRHLRRNDFANSFDCMNKNVAITKLMGSPIDLVQQPDTVLENVKRLFMLKNGRVVLDYYTGFSEAVSPYVDRDDWFPEFTDSLNKLLDKFIVQNNINPIIRELNINLPTGIFIYPPDNTCFTITPRNCCFFDTVEHYNLIRWILFSNGWTKCNKFLSDYDVSGLNGEALSKGFIEFSFWRAGIQIYHTYLKTQGEFSTIRLTLSDSDPVTATFIAKRLALSMDMMELFLHNEVPDLINDFVERSKLAGGNTVDVSKLAKSINLVCGGVAENIILNGFLEYFRTALVVFIRE